MTDYKEILRVIAQGLSQRNTALACGVSRNTVADIETRYRVHKLKYSLLIIDEFLLFPITIDESKVLADLIDRRNRKASTIIVSQYEPGEWIEQIPNPLAAESMTDRLKSNSYHVFIDGKISMRERYGFQ